MALQSDEALMLPISGKHVLKIALRVKQLIDTIIPIQFEASSISRPDSPILTQKVYDLLLDSAGGKGGGEPGTSSRRYRAVLVFALLIVRRWNKSSSLSVLYDSELYETRALAAEVLALKFIDSEQDEYYLFRDVLCRRYSITIHGRDARPLNALELAVDMHATIVIGAAGFQRCINWLWRGWIIQSDEDPTVYTFYKYVNDTRFLRHFDPERIKTPMYQNYIQLIISFVYLGLYTICINTISGEGEPIELFEASFYIFTFGFVWDELTKFYSVGWDYIGFWNVFNDTLYVLVITSFALRWLALSFAKDSAQRLEWDVIAYRTFACAAPLIWGRILLFLDSIQFFGAMLVVLKELMKESIIFYVLLIVVSGGFLQAFVGLDTADDAVRNFSMELVKVMTMTVLDSPDFELFDNFAPPYGKVLYCIFTFLISTLLLNILVALFNSAYEKIYDNAVSEYMALVAQKTLRFVRAPDENVFVPPFNLIELLFLMLPFEWWMDQTLYEQINNIILTFIYSPFLLVIGWKEAKAARRINYNRSRGFHDDANEVDEQWDLTDGYDDSDSQHDNHIEVEQMEAVIAAGDPEFIIDEKAWLGHVQNAAPKIEKGDSVGVGWESYALYEKIEKLTIMVEELKKQIDEKK